MNLDEMAIAHAHAQPKAMSHELMVSLYAICIASMKWKREGEGAWRRLIGICTMKLGIISLIY